MLKQGLKLTYHNLEFAIKVSKYMIKKQKIKTNKKRVVSKAEYRIFVHKIKYCWVSHNDIPSQRNNLFKKFLPAFKLNFRI